MVNGDVPGNGATGGAPGGEGSGDEAAWLDLVARFDTTGVDSDEGDTPWPEREDLAGAVPVTPAFPEALPVDPPASPAGKPGPPRVRLGGIGPRDTVAPEDPANTDSSLRSSRFVVFDPRAPPDFPSLLSMILRPIADICYKPSGVAARRL